MNCQLPGANKKKTITIYDQHEPNQSPSKLCDFRKTTLPETNSLSPLKINGLEDDSFPLGAFSPFAGAFAVSFREGNLQSKKSSDRGARPETAQVLHSGTYRKVDKMSCTPMYATMKATPYLRCFNPKKNVSPKAPKGLKLKKNGHNTHVSWNQIWIEGSDH